MGAGCQAPATRIRRRCGGAQVPFRAHPGRTDAGRQHGCLARVRLRLHTTPAPHRPGLNGHRARRGWWRLLWQETFLPTLANLCTAQPLPLPKPSPGQGSWRSTLGRGRRDRLPECSRSTRTSDRHISVGTRMVGSGQVKAGGGSTGDLSAPCHLGAGRPDCVNWTSQLGFRGPFWEPSQKPLCPPAELGDG